MKVLIVCVARHLANVTPELFAALRTMTLYTLRTPGHKKDTVDFIVLTEQPRDSKGKRLPGNQAIRWNLQKIRKYILEHYHYIIRLDSDMVPPPHALITLIKTAVKHKAPIVTALTPERPSKVGTEEFSQLMSWNTNKPRKKIISSIENLEPFICSGNAGVAFMLMTREAFKIIRWPGLKDDFGFWIEVHKQKIKVVCNPRVVCGHKDHSRGIVRGTQWVIAHWLGVIIKNLTAKHAWYHGLPYKWWHGLIITEFLQMFPKHLAKPNIQEKEPKWFTYRGKLR